MRGYKHTHTSCMSLQDSCLSSVLPLPSHKWFHHLILFTSFYCFLLFISKPIVLTHFLYLDQSITRNSWSLGAVGIFLRAQSFKMATFSKMVSLLQFLGSCTSGDLGKKNLKCFLHIHSFVNRYLKAIQSIKY